MKSQPDVAERLKGVGHRIPVGEPPIDRIIRRGRRRFAGKVATSSLLALVLGAAVIWSGRGLLFARSEELRLGDGTTIPKPHVVSTIPLSGVPWGAAFDGTHLWVASYFDNLVSEVDPKTNEEVQVIPVPDRAPYNVVAGDEGVWADGYGAILRIDPTTGQVTELPSLAGGRHGHSYPAGMAVGNGSLWLSESNSQGSLLRVHPETNEILARITLGDVTEIAFGEGSVWVGGCSENPQAHALIWRIDPATNAVIDTLRLPPVDACAFFPVVDDGAIYVSTAHDEYEAPRMWKIDADTGRVIWGPLTVRMAGPPLVYRGVVWVVTRLDRSSDDAFLTLVDATTMEMIGRPIPVGQFGRRVAQGGGSVWVPSVEDGRPTLFRIAP